MIFFVFFSSWKLGRLVRSTQCPWYGKYEFGGWPLLHFIPKSISRQLWWKTCQCFDHLFQETQFLFIQHHRWPLRISWFIRQISWTPWNYEGKATILWRRRCSTSTEWDRGSKIKPKATQWRMGTLDHSSLKLNPINYRFWSRLASKKGNLPRQFLAGSQIKTHVLNPRFNCSFLKYISKFFDFFSVFFSVVLLFFPCNYV